MPANLEDIERAIKAIRTTTIVEVIDEKIILCDGAYNAEDVVSEAATGAFPWLFKNMAKREGGGGYIIGGLILGQTTAIASLFTLFLFSGKPTCATGDDVANTAVIQADRRISQGSISFNACSDLGTGMSQAEATPSTYGKLPKPFVCASDSRDLQGILVIHNALDLADSTTLTIKLYVEQY